jgi:hypothetical protein
MKKLGYVEHKRIQFYSYDVNSEAYPAGVEPGVAPEEDLDGSKHAYAVQNASIPKLIFLPGNNKGLPFLQYQLVVTAAQMMDWAREMGHSKMPRAKSASFGYSAKNGYKAEFGQRDADQKIFFDLIAEEGVISSKKKDEEIDDTLIKTDL